MVQSPSGAATWFAASQEIPRISRNPKVHYRTHNRPPPVSILGQPNPVHIPTSHLPEIRPNILLKILYWGEFVTTVNNRVFVLWVTEMFSETFLALHRETQLSKSTSAYRSCVGYIF